MRDGDLVGIIEVFELSGEVRNFTDAEMVRDAPIMLDRNALPYYGPYVKGRCEKYHEAITKLLSWFTSDEQCAYLLQEGHGTRLTAWFGKHRDKS